MFLGIRKIDQGTRWRCWLRFSSCRSLDCWNYVLMGGAPDETERRGCNSCLGLDQRGLWVRQVCRRRYDPEPSHWRWWVESKSQGLIHRILGCHRPDEGRDVGETSTESRLKLRWHYWPHWRVRCFLQCYHLPCPGSGRVREHQQLQLRLRIWSCCSRCRRRRLLLQQEGAGQGCCFQRVWLPFGLIIS